MADHSSLLPPDLERALRDRVPLAPAERTRRVNAIMGALQAVPAPRAAANAELAPSWASRLRALPLRALPRRDLPPTISRWHRRGVLGSAGAMAFAAMLTLWVGVTSLTDVFAHSGAVLARAEVIGDTVIPRRVPSGVAPTAHAALGDTLYDTIYDTMRIVRFALRAPAATRVALVQSASHAVRDSAERHFRVARDVASGLWELRTVVPRDAVVRSFAFVVDDADRIPVRAASWSEGFPPTPRTTREPTSFGTSF